MKTEKFALFTISLFVFSVLLYASFTALLNGSDEENHFFIASKISFKPDSLNLPFGFVKLVPHPLLQAYLIKMGFVLFGKEAIFSGRFMFVLLGTLVIPLVYFLVKRGINKRIALLSIVLLSVEKYYMCHMRYAISESVCIFFSILAIFVFFKSLKEDNRFLMLLVGVITGVGFYGKENILLLFPIFFIYLFWDRQYRFWLRRKEIYLALLVCCGISTPFIVYNLYHNLFTFRYITDVAKFGLSPLSTTVLFGEPLSFLFDASVVRDVFDCEYPVMNWLVGVVVLCGVVYSTMKSRDNSLIKLLLVIFFFIFILFSLIGYRPETEPKSLCNGQNWPSMMVIPGVILAANMLFAFWNKYKRSRLLIIVLIGYLLFDLMRLVNLPESFYIPRKDIMLMRLRDLAQYDLARGYYGYAKKRFEKLLKISKDKEHLEEARLNLLYLSKVVGAEDIKEYYVPAKDIFPEEIMKQAEFFFNIGENGFAINRYQEVIWRAPYGANTVKAYNNLGVIYARQGRLKQAKQQWNRVLQIEPQNAEAKRNLDKY